MGTMKYSITILAAAALLFLPGCLDERIFQDLKDATIGNTVPVGSLLNPGPMLNDLEITFTDSGTITLAQPTISKGGTADTIISAYIGIDGVIKVLGPDVSFYDGTEIDVTAGGHSFTGLDSYTTYRIIAVASNPKGYSVKQIVQSTEGIAPALNDLSLSDILLDSITLAKPTFATAGNPAPTVTAYIGPTTGGASGPIAESGGVVSGTILDTANVTNAGCIFDGLTMATEYRIIVVAENDLGYSVKSEVRTTAGDGPTVSNLVISNATSNSITLAKPTTTGNPPPTVTAYIGPTVGGADGPIYESGGEIYGTILSSMNASGGACAFSGLGTGVEYRIIVVAENGVSYAVKQTTEKTPDLRDVTGLSAVYSSCGVVLTWTDPSPSTDVDHLEVTWSPNGSTAQDVTIGTQTYKALGLTDGQAYTFTVKAVDKWDNATTGTTATITVHTGWHTFLGSSNEDEVASVQQTSDGGYILAGGSYSNIATLQGKTPLNAHDSVTDYDMLVVKLDASGNVAWYTFLGSSSTDYAKSVQQTSDGGYIVAGYALANIATLQTKTPLNAYTSNTDFLVVKLDSSGNVSWYTFLGGSGSQEAKSIQQTSDGGYIVAGFSDANIASLQTKTPLNAHYAGTNEDQLVIKLDSSGNVAWYTFLGGAGDEEAQSIQQLSDGYIVSGYSTVNIATLQTKTPLNAHYTGTNKDQFMVKLDTSGNTAWYTFLGDAGDDDAYSVQQTADGGYIVSGSASANIASLQTKTPLNAYASGTDMLVVKLDSSGNTAWYTFLGGSGNDHAYSIQQTADSGYIVVGDAGASIATLQSKTTLNAFAGGTTDIFAVKLNSSGNTSWFTFLGGTGREYAYSVRQTSDNGFIIGGYSYNVNFNLWGFSPRVALTGSTDFFVIKLVADGTM